MLKKISYHWDSKRGILGDERQRASIGPVVEEMAATAYKEGEYWFGRYGHGCTCGEHDTEQEAVDAAHTANLSEGFVEDHDLAMRRAERMAELRRDGLSVAAAYQAAKEVM